MNKPYLQVSESPGALDPTSEEDAWKLTEALTQKEALSYLTSKSYGLSLCGPLTYHPVPLAKQNKPSMLFQQLQYISYSL